MKYWISSPLMGMMIKEFIHLLRDKLSIVLIIIFPLIQLILLGNAINLNPKHLPTAIVGGDQSPITRRILDGMQNSTYFNFISPSSTEQEAHKLFSTGQVLYVLTFPPNFSHDVIRGLKPQLLLEADATDSASTSRGINTFSELARTVLKDELKGVLSALAPADNGPYEAVVHPVYNPLVITSINVTPGLLGVELMMSLISAAATTISRERERGTMENLLSTPLSPTQVIIGKISPYIIIGYIQVILILIFSRILFDIPMEGSITLLFIFSLPYIVANLTFGLMISTIAKTPLQANQMAIFFLLPSILLSGFLFPFYGMPVWAQFLGNLLPLTHFLIIVRGILIKGNTFFDLWRELIPIFGFTLAMLFIGKYFYQKTLD